MIPFMQNTSLRQYVRGKPSPVGLQICLLASPIGLVREYFVYQGKGYTFPSLSVHGDITK